MLHQATFVMHNAEINENYLYLAGKSSLGFTSYYYLPSRRVA